MKQLFQFISLLFLALTLAACGGKTVKGSGKVSTQERKVAHFDRIKAEGALDLLVTANASQEVSVIADDNLQQYIMTKVKGKTLEILTKKGYILDPVNPVHVRVHVGKLLSVATAGEMRVGISDIEGRTFNVTSAGSSAIMLTGKVEKASIGIAGASQVDAQHLLAEEVGLDVAGTAKVSVYASKKLNVKISGEGEVSYYGNPPIVNQAVFGNGKIQRAQ